MKLKHFTLIEAVAIVSTLLVLAGMSMPVLNHSKDQAHTLVCANNLRLLHSAAMMYYEDWASLPPVGFEPTHRTPEEERNDPKATAVVLHTSFGSYHSYFPEYDGYDMDQAYFCPAAYPHRESTNSSDYGVNVGLFRRMNTGKHEQYPTAIIFADGYGDYHLSKRHDWIGFRWRHGEGVKTANVYAPVVGGNADVVGRYGDGSIQSIFVDGSVHMFKYADREQVYENHIGIVPDDRY